MNRKLLFGGVLLALVLAFVLAMQAFTGTAPGKVA